MFLKNNLYTYYRYKRLFLSSTTPLSLRNNYLACYICYNMQNNIHNISSLYAVLSTEGFFVSRAVIIHILTGRTSQSVKSST